MSIQSPYSIVLTPAGGEPVTLVEAGGWLAELPAFEASQDLFETDGVLLADAFFRPLGNVAVSIEFTTEEDLADLATVLTAFLAADDSPAGSLLQMSGALAVGGTEFAAAVVTVITPDLPSGAAATLTRVFSIKTSLPTDT